MTQQLSTQKSRDNQPWYSQAWSRLKHFPKGLAQGAKNPPVVSGPAAAALISAAIGCFTMMVIHHLSDTSKAREKMIWTIGSWIPGSHNPSPIWGNIGSYTGKETMLLVGWLISWVLLHILWKNQAIKAKTIFFWLLTLLIAATAMCWHPLFPYLPLT
ncbi:hypothetical protein [Gloeothece verrucosa]|uniref:Uncharacterized protein n=1 Tax=Gloeothece verrucosa (strain PCC 7822) TaxID=497965 RepID=E0UJG8_GLOV7|nr:hypothetical protein [Gloeothece verrucosa]ADN16986.1 conserved hypothetical protein [Gloeothece verrucosa PCC 7822]